MASVVGTYARAFTDVVMKDSGRIDPTRALQELRSFQALLQESDQLRRVLENPAIPEKQLLGLIDTLATRLAISKPVRNFIAVITDHQRLSLLGEIIDHFAKELDERLGYADAHITSARGLSDQEKQMLEAEIARLTGKKVKAKYGQDASLLGGAVVQVGSTIYDGSVKGQLEKIGEQLAAD